MAENLSGSDGEMVASYAIAITGIQRTKAEMARLDAAISLLRKTDYSGGGATVSEARFGTSRGDKLLNGKKDIFVASVDILEGRIQSKASKIMAKAVAHGKVIQAATLRAATTKTGQRRGSNPGREVTGTLIKELSTNVETQKVSAVTNIVGWHGWRRERQDYFKYQEQGSKGRASGQQFGSLNRKVKKRGANVEGRGVPAANSLGAAIIPVREQLKRDLKDLKR